MVRCCTSLYNLHYPRTVIDSTSRECLGRMLHHYAKIRIPCICETET